MVKVSSDPEIEKIFDVNRLGVASYFLALLYFVFALSGTLKLRRINKILTQWNSQKFFHTFVLFLLYVRCFSFAALSIFSIFKIDIWYPILVILFTAPEYFMLSTYCLLFFHWLETFLFAHEQYFVQSKKIFRRTWLSIFLIITVMLYAALGVLYTLLLSRAASYEDQVSEWIELTSAIGCFALPGLASLAICYLSFFLLSGFPYSTAIAKERVDKINTVFLVWSLGRLIRGALLVVSIAYSWQTQLSEVYVSMLLVSILVISELVPVILALDWSIVAMLLLGEDTIKQRTVPLAYPSNGESAIDEWQIDPGEIRFSDEYIEDSGFSFTQKASWNGRPISIKGFRFQHMSQQIIDELANDLVEFSALDHPHIAQFLGISRMGSTIYQITEYFPIGSLYDVIRQSQKNFSEQVILRLAKEIAMAMEHLHSFDQVHGHLSSRNVLLDSTMRAKVGDVGIRRLKAYAEVMLVKRMATAWSAPEVLSGETGPTKASDVYSFGVICWELLTRSIPFEGLSIDDISKIVVRKRERLNFDVSRIERQYNLPPFFCKLIKKCWKHNPDLRPSFEQILSSIKAESFGSQPTNGSSDEKDNHDKPREGTY